MNKWKIITSWILRIFTALGFLMASLGKLSNNPSVLDMFQNWGFPQGFNFIIGILELTLGVMLLIPRTLKIAIFGLGIIMIGAMLTHVINDPILNVLRPVLFSIFLFGIYYLNFFKKATPKN